MEPSKKLTPVDFKILKYINDFSDIKKDKIILHFSDIQSIKYRLDFLIENKYLLYIDKHIPVMFTLYDLPNEYSLPIHTDRIQITDKGKKELEDYLQKQRTERLSLSFKIIARLGSIIGIILGIKSCFLG